MTTDTRAALLRRILDDPQDDGVRLVYADALEEAGELERSEFIRVQLEIAEVEPKLDHNLKRMVTHPRDKCWCVLCGEWRRWEQLRRREAELLTANYQKWCVVPPYTTHGLADTLEVLCTDLRPYNPAGTARFRFRRGFVSEIRLPLAAWVGGACGRCRGSGTWDRGDDDSGGPHVFTCPSCRGTGTLPGVGPRVVACQPVEVVRVSDREPYHGGGQWSWYDETKVSLGLHPKSDLPSSVFRLLPRSECGEDNHGVYYPTEAAANAALSAALITMAKVPV